VPESAALRLVFAGTPEFAEAHLAGLLSSRHQVVAVYTQPDRPSGRGRRLHPSPVKALALAHAIPVEQPETLRCSAAQATLAALQPDAMIVVAYGLILPPAVLAIPRLGCINVHASLLPRWRGAAPIQRAIEAGDTETGICIMRMEKGLDTGPVLTRTRCAITADATGGSLHQQLLDLGPPLLLQVLERLEQALENAQPQPAEGVTYAHKLDKAESQLDWRQPALVLERKVRAFNPFPVAATALADTTVRIWSAHRIASPATAAPGTILAADREGISVACGADALLLTALQLPGGKPLPASALLNAHSALFAPGTLLGASA